jgi:deoxyribose-phosphate aldolase
VNATLPVGLVMAQAIRAHAERRRVGLKPSGGIRTAPQALAWLTLAREELGEPWTRPALLRLGASALLADIESRLRELRI